MSEDPYTATAEQEREIEARAEKAEADKLREQIECDHEWEYESADPSVGIMSGSKTCVICGEEGPDDRGDDFDDNYF